MYSEFWFNIFYISIINTHLRPTCYFNYKNILIIYLHLTFETISNMILFVPTHLLPTFSAVFFKHGEQIYLLDIVSPCIPDTLIMLELLKESFV